MTAHATLPDGTVVRYHRPPAFTECSNPHCQLPHVKWAELFADLLAENDGAKS